VIPADEPAMTVYGAPWCPHCKRVKKFLAAHRVRYAFVDIDTDPQAIARLKRAPGRRADHSDGHLPGRDP